MAHVRYYCLRCKKPNMGCKCGKTDMHFRYWHGLRVPTDTKKHAIFRKFLDDCPGFINMIDESQREAFLKLLREIRYFNKTIAGRKWTNISK